MEKKKEIHSYLRPSRVIYIFGPFFIILSIAAILDGAQVGGMVAIMLFFVALSCGPTAYKELSIQAALKEDETKNNLDALYDDFTTGIKIGKDDVRIGKNYIFGRRCEGYYKISDIKKIYQFVHKTNFVEDKRILKAELSDGSTVNLMRLKLGKGENDDLMKAVTTILALNPSVKVGYK